MAIIRKTTQSHTQESQKKQVIKVNPYENPENVMELMAKICSAVPSANTDIYWNVINNASDKEVSGKTLFEYLFDNRANLLNPDFSHDLIDLCKRISWSLDTRENTEHTQIVVAGGFSSGKSSFLNRITNCASLLPTGVEPVSVVKTYLYCSRNNKSINVKGVNHKNVLVNLDPGVLQAIQHAKTSNIYLASVLDKLFVEIPSQELDGLVFIDTPGYNNSDKQNQSNGKTDRETAIEALGEGNVLFWLIDCERGTTVSDDIEIIKKFPGKKVFIFNKADKKGLQECAKIVEEASKTLYREFPEDEIIDIIAYSTLDNKVYCSKNNMTLKSIIEEAKASGNGISELNSLKNQIYNLFEDEISACQDMIQNIEDSYKEKLDNKKSSLDRYRNIKDYLGDSIKEFASVIVENYNIVSSTVHKFHEAGWETIEKFGNFFDAVVDWDNTDHDCFYNTLTPIIQDASYRFDACVENLKSIKCEFYDEEYRNDLVKQLKDVEDFVVNVVKSDYEKDCKECEDALERKKIEQSMISDMQEFQNIFINALDSGIQQFQRQNKATIVHSEDISKPNVFECIVKDDYKQFMHCFEDGVDLSICNADGYNPLTLAVHVGNNAMVKFMLNHEADPSIKDRRGYNAFHTAVENQYRDICKILLDYDMDLVDTKTAAGESVEALAQKQTFSKWIEKELY
ncbi:MAG: dynamin family protein [Muribaculaceae bacterium]